MLFDIETTRRAARRRARRRRRREGMTLIEIMIVVIIMALIATAVGVAVLPQFGKAKEKKAETDVGTIKQAALSYLLSGGEGCPTVDDLIDARELDADTEPTDPWGNEYDIVCDGDSVVVTSSGEDGELDSEDDISTRRSRED
jgi:general secretion pathway protein G